MQKDPQSPTRPAGDNSNAIATTAFVASSSQPLDSDLTAIAALSATGILVRTGADTWALRTLQQPAAGLTITNPAGIAADPALALANDLAALEALSAVGFATRTGADTWMLRSILGTTDEIVLTNGDGVSGNPTISLAPFLQAGTGAVARSVRTKLRETVSVKDFGAVGDGATNDSAAIQAALNAVSSAGGGTVFFPPGTYIASGLSWPNNLILRGEGNGRDAAFANISCLRLPANSAAGSYIIASSTFINNQAFVNLGQGAFDLLFDGDKANQTNDALANVICRGFASRFFDCSFMRSSGHGFLLTCESANGTDGAGIANTDFLECEFNDSDFAGLYCDDDGADHMADIFIRSCVFAFNGQVDDGNKWRNLMSERGVGFHIVDNQMYGCPNGNILLQLAGLSTITGNNLDAGAIGNNDANVELVLGGFAQLTVTSNIFWNDAGSGTGKVHLLINGTSAAFRSLAITGNSFSFTTLTGANAQAITLSGFPSGEVERAVFAGNSFHPLSTQPQRLNGAWQTKMKQAATTRASTTTLTADPDLTFSMAASTNYGVRGRIFYETPAAADFKWRHAGPASPFLVQLKRNSIAPGATAFGNIAVDTAFSAADIVITETSGQRGYIEFEAIIFNQNAGDFQFQWAQNSSDGTGTTVWTGSYLEYRVLP